MSTNQIFWRNVIKNESADSTDLIWKYPVEDFNINSKLIVGPGEVAVFINCGEVAGIFHKGEYDLNTGNYPISRYFKFALSGGMSTCPCKVYFVRTTITKQLFWGTDSPLYVRDSKQNFVTSVQARGSYSVVVTNPNDLFTNLYGSSNENWSQEKLTDYVSDKVRCIAKNEISAYLESATYELVSVNSHLSEISGAIKEKLSSSFAEYGIYFVAFSISAIDVDMTNYKKLDDAVIDSRNKVILAEADSQIMNLQGRNWSTQQLFNTVRNSSGKPSSDAGSIISLLAASEFLKKDGSKNVPIANNGFHEAIEVLKSLRSEGVISEEQYNSKVQELVSRF